MKTIKQTYRVEAPIEGVWEALVNPGEIDAWGGGPAIMDDKVGTEFSLWNGDIHGKNIEVKQYELLKQEWVSGDWPEPSIVTFVLKPDGNGTKIELVHENIPDKEAKEIEDGWKKYYLGEIKNLLEA